MSTRPKLQLGLWLALVVIRFDILVAAPPHRSSAAELDRLVQDKNYPRLEQELASADLDNTARVYFAGIVADRKNRPLDAIAALEKALPQLRAGHPKRAAVALRALADDYFMAGRYGQARQAYSDLLEHFAPLLSVAEKQTATDNRNIFALLSGQAPQVVGGEREFTVPTRRDPIGDIDVPIGVGSSTEWWIFDTGANQSTISLSTARRLDLVISQGTASTKSGATGKEVPLRVAVIPKLIFGKAVVRNVVALVMDDKDLDINFGENRHYQIQGVLGYPVLSALGSFTLSPEGIAVRAKTQLSSRSSRLYVEELTPLLEAEVDGHDLLFGLDTGANGATLSAKYLRGFSRQFATLKLRKEDVGGAGGLREVSDYHLPQLVLDVGSASATLKDVSVLTRDLGLDPLDGLYGNIGQVLLNQFRTCTIDLAGMHFIAGENAN